MKRNTLSVPVNAASKRWWREPWLWLVIVGPAVVVVAGIATYVIAARGADALVTPDYYRKGLELPKEGDARPSAPMLPAGQARNHAATGGVPGKTPQ
jgi:uncharacterized protein